ncbi:haloacid dehalogenase-like hydrolase [Antribacter sp. KLBMP9083]|uniref:Haloacid dehalogenase-like hydrolase n=1 Tax=Antribacter soli TaxID=2910976 RepID=A0AA41U7G4_9MICO|nr:haloacid dehalogenase-like hydrolase [Antribacter soli]MCF4122023.1 haloacid dehalogenase-like hydrolase [Antribacter soli]
MTVLVLWDVDHTLVENGGVSKESYAGAFELLTGQTARSRARTDGRTDPEIMADLLRDHGVDPGSFSADSIREALVESLETRRGRLAEKGHALLGARAAIDALTEAADVVQSVLTGNTRTNGFVKLEVFGLADALDWDCGGFGFDAQDRPGLVAVAQRRAAAQHGGQFDGENTVLIGDTVNDVRAGILGGARVVAVATGADDVDTLAAAGATRVLPDLSDTAAVVAAVAAAAGRPTWVR